jgi:CxxC motif-containing protein (DUF1111 family)
MHYFSMGRRLASLALACIVIGIWRFSLGQLIIQAINPTAASSFLQVHKSQLPSNATSCADCHAVPVTGGSSRVTVTRAGRTIAGQYVGIGQDGTFHAHGDGSVNTTGLITGHRVALNLLGDGYVESVARQAIEDIAKAQKKESGGKIHGESPIVTLPEQNAGTNIIGRFGWKAQHASLLSASADALRSELGVPNEFFAIGESESNSSSEKRLGANPQELDAMVRFLRSTEPVAPDAERSATESAEAGSRIFKQIGCSICHVRTLRTAPPGTRLNDGTLVVSVQLGNKEIHPFSDYLLHDVGTGDGIVQNIRPQDYDGSTANKFRTAPLWGVRFRSWLMHDGKSITYHQAIMRHAGEASDCVERYERLTPKEKEELRLFLNSL